MSQEDMNRQHFETTAREAAQNWRVEYEDYRGPYSLVEAVANTGSRYVVMTTRFASADTADRYAGTHMVSVVYPVKAAFVATQGDLHMSYVHEKVYDAQSEVHGGDLAALTATIQHALNGAFSGEIADYRSQDGTFSAEIVG